MNKPSYYAIVPAKVRYDKDLCPNAKLLYGEITCLSEIEGFCWASNAYFAKLYHVQITTISEWIKQLNDKGYVKTMIDREAGNKRKIYLPGAIREKPKTSSGKAEDPYSGNPEDINTSKNIKIYKKPTHHKHGDKVLLTEAGYKALCDKHGKILIDKYIGKVNDYCVMHGKTYKDYKRAIENFIRSDKERGSLKADPVPAGWKCKACGKRNFNTMSFCAYCKEVKE